MNRIQAKRLLRLADYLAAHREPDQAESGLGFDMMIVYSSDYRQLELSESEWLERHPCGIAACVMGHAGLIPEFRKLGLIAHKAGVGMGAGSITLKDEPIDLETAGMDLFGLGAEESMRLFLDGYDMTADEKADELRCLVQSYHPDLVAEFAG